MTPLCLLHPARTIAAAALYCAAKRANVAFPDDARGLSLANWHTFEQENPSLFIRMYTFTVQKPL